MWLRFSIAVIFLCVVRTGYATEGYTERLDLSADVRDIYVDSELGEDENPGSHDRPVKTLNALSKLISTGGWPYIRVLLQCQSAWRETLTVISRGGVKKLEINSYGKNCLGKKPRIFGSESIEVKWDFAERRWAGSWSAEFDFSSGPVYFAGKAYWPTRVSGRAVVAKGDLNSKRLEVEFDNNNDYKGLELRGGNILIYSSPWYVDTRKILSAVENGNALILDHKLSYKSDSKMAFSIENVNWVFGASGTFSVSPSTGLIKVAPHRESLIHNSEASFIEIPKRLYGIRVIGVRDVVIRSVHVEYTKEVGIALEGIVAGGVFESIISSAGKYGIKLKSPGLELRKDLPYRSVSVSGNYISGVQEFGIKSDAAMAVQVDVNRIDRVGMDGYMGASFAGIDVGAESWVIGNNITRTAYAAIRFVAQGDSRVIDNIIDDSCYRLSDCGAIYTYNSKSSSAQFGGGSILQNRVYYSSRSYDYYASGSWIRAGIYLDDGTADVDVIDNIVSGASIGIYIHNASNSRVHSNKISEALVVSIWINLDSRERRRTTLLLQGNSVGLRCPIDEETPGAKRSHGRRHLLITTSGGMAAHVEDLVLDVNGLRCLSTCGDVEDAVLMVRNGSRNGHRFSRQDGLWVADSSCY